MPDIFPQGVSLRDLDDVATTRTNIYDGVLKAFQSIEPVSNQRYTLRLSNVGYQGRDAYSKSDENRAILEGRTLGRRMTGNWELVDNATQAPIETRQATLANVPYYSSLGTFINNGTEYGMQNQLRLRPGTFAREKESGELEQHVNVAKGFGHRYFLDPATGVFRIQVGQSRMPLVPLLKALGATDEQIRNTWGNDLWSANMRKHDPTALRKLYQKIYGNRKEIPPDDLGMADSVRKAFEAIELDDDVTRRTLGKPYKNMNAEVVLAATKKLLAINKGEADTDDRDAMQYQKFLGPEDIFADRVKLAKQQLRQMLWKVTNQGSLKSVKPNAFDRVVRGALLDTGLGNALEEVNPAEILDNRMKITRMGEGGIPSSDSVPEDSRNVHTSHLGFIDLIHTPESGRIGIDSRVTVQTKKGNDGRLYSRFRDPRTGDYHWLSPQDVAEKTVAFPNELASDKRWVRTISSGRMRFMPRDKVDFELPHMTEAFGPLANLIPMKGNSKGQRGSMGSRMTTQALSLTNAEAPLVQSLVPGDTKSFEEAYGKHLGAVSSDADGQVVAVTPEHIKVKGADGKVQEYELYNHRTFNRKSYLHNLPTVQVGQMVRAGDLLARSNYTNDKGAVALGLNANVAYMSNGHNFEDAFVVSQSFAKRSASQHAYQYNVDKADGLSTDKKKFLSIFPSRYPRQVLEKFDDDGIIKVGAKVDYDDPLILGVQQATVGPRLGRRKHSFRENITTWDHHQPGIVTDVVKTKNGINVVVKGEMETKTADKISGRFGDKGIIAQILPDHMMPHDSEGRPFDVLINEHGLASRGNASQHIEAALGKIAAKTGQPYKVEDFGQHQDLAEWARQELKKHGLSATETVTDPVTGRKIPDVYTGNRYIMKLHHMAESKAQGRGIGGYSQDEAPAKGGYGGGKRVGLLDLNAILSYGAFKVGRDATAIRGQKDENRWRMLMSGHTPPPPQIPFVYRKFMAELQAMGINPIRQGTKIQALALTDKDINELAGDREITSPETVDWNTDRLEPKAGGLFDPKLTGGHGGNRWAYVKLHEPLPNPVMEDPIKKLLGLTQSQYEDILSGKATPSMSSKGGVGQFDPHYTGPTAIVKALTNIHVDKEIARAQLEIRGSRKTARDAAIKRIGFLKMAQATGRHPSQWVVSKVPVLPPVFRPVSVMKGSGNPLVADPNFLYRDLLEANTNWKKLSGQIDDVAEERLSTYNAFKAVTGISDPIKPQTAEQKVKGILKHIVGTSPKYGTVQRKLLGSVVDLVGRATIAPNPDLDMDQVGIPEEEAWELYKPFIVRRLVRNGMRHMQAVEAVDQKNKLAEKAMLAEMESRPVMVNRAPVLHRFGVLAMRPTISHSKALEMPLLVYAGLGADNDGDAMQFHVIQDEDAAKEALDKMLPSRNLFSPASFKSHHMPTQAYVAGMYKLTTARSDKPMRVFRSKKDALAAYQRGDLDFGDPIQILDT